MNNLDLFTEILRNWSTIKDPKVRLRIALRAFLEGDDKAGDAIIDLCLKGLKFETEFKSK